MSAISLLHAIGVLLILLPSIHLADRSTNTTNSTTTAPTTTTTTLEQLSDVTRVLWANQNQTMHSIKELSSRVTRTGTGTAIVAATTTRMTMTMSTTTIPTTYPPLRIEWTKDDKSSERSSSSTSGPRQLDEFGRERRSSRDLILHDDPSEPLQLPSSTRVIGPYFESNRTSTTLSSRAGQDVMLDCAVVLLQGRTVSWLRRRSENLQLLTVGNQTYSSDSRLGLHFRYPNNWRLGILKVNKRDEGEYQCQLSTHPPKALVFHLRVIAPAVQILDDNEHVITERHYKVDSSLHLTCRASHLDKLADHVTWFKGDRLLPGTDTRVKVKQWKNQTNGEASAFLSVLSVRKGDSGNYSCRASSLAQNTVVVHVLNEKLPAAVQHGNSANVLSVCHRDFVLCLLTAKGLLPSLLSLLISHLERHHFIYIPYS